MHLAKIVDPPGNTGLTAKSTDVRKCATCINESMFVAPCRVGAANHLAGIVDAIGIAEFFARQGAEILEPFAAVEYGVVIPVNAVGAGSGISAANYLPKDR